LAARIEIVLQTIYFFVFALLCPAKSLFNVKTKVMNIRLSLNGRGMSVSKIFFSFLVFLFTASVISCKKEPLAPISSNNLSAESLTTSDASKASEPKYGAWISGHTIDKQIDGCNQLKVTYVRHGITLKNFNGKSNKMDKYLKNGYKILLNISYESYSDKAVPFPTDMKEYKRLLNKLLDKYKPEIAIIENEPTTDKFHKGPIEDYITELKAAVAVCKDRGVKVADGSLNLQLVQQVMNGYNNKTANYIETKKLIEAYKTIDLDYVNIHTHAPFTDHDNPDKFPKDVVKNVADYIRKKTGKQVICNEYNQRNNSKELMHSAVDAFAAAGFKYFLAHSNDDDGKAMALYTGKSLTRIGETYRDAKK